MIQQLKNEIKNALLIKDKEILLINEHQPLQTIKSFENIPPVYQIKNLKDDLIKLRAELTQIAKILKEKSSKSELNDYKYLVDKRFQEISKEMLLKASVKDICILLDMKANIEDINIALTDVHKELDLKASIIALNTGINVQNENISVLLSLNSLARWVWKGGILYNGYLIPWDVQIINSLPDNFIWEPSASNIIISTSGLYEINFGIYGKRKLGVQLLIDGQIALNSDKLNNQGCVKRKYNNTEEYVTGITMIDFIAISAKSKISLYLGEEGQNCEGFLCIKKIL